MRDRGSAGPDVLIPAPRCPASHQAGARARGACGVWEAVPGGHCGGGVQAGLAAARGEEVHWEHAGHGVHAGWSARGVGGAWGLGVACLLERAAKQGKE